MVKVLTRRSETIPKPRNNKLSLIGFIKKSKRDGIGASERTVHLYNKKTCKNIFISESEIDAMIATNESKISINLNKSANLTELISKWKSTNAAPKTALSLETLINLKAGLLGKKSIYNNGNQPRIDGLDLTLL